MEEKKIQSALISVFSKDGIKPIVDELRKRNVTIYSTVKYAKMEMKMIA